MTATDHLKTIREQHHSTVRHWFKHSTTDCAHCLTRWPCDASRLLDAVEAVQKYVDLAQADYLDDWERGYQAAMADVTRAITTALEGK